MQQLLNKVNHKPNRERETTGHSPKYMRNKI